MLLARRSAPGKWCTHTTYGATFHIHGAFQPFSWAWGQAKPTQNEFSWTNLSSVLWVEQPVGTGFSQGVPNIKACFLHLCALPLTRWIPFAGRGRLGCPIHRIHATVPRSFRRIEGQKVLSHRRKCKSATTLRYPALCSPKASVRRHVYSL